MKTVMFMWMHYRMHHSKSVQTRYKRKLLSGSGMKIINHAHLKVWFYVCFICGCCLIFVTSCSSCFTPSSYLMPHHRVVFVWIWWGSGDSGFCARCRWSVTFLWSSGGSAVSKTPLWAATSDKGDLAGLPSRSPPLPAQVCRVGHQLHHLLFCLLYVFVFFPLPCQIHIVGKKKAFSWQWITDCSINPFIFTWPAANIVLAFILPFLPISFSFSDLSTDTVWWPLSNPQ